MKMAAKMAGWPRFSTALLLIFAASVVLRIGVALYLGDSTPPGKDETSYSILAMRLVDGFGYSFPRAWYPGFVPADTPTSHWSFLYTAFVAGVYAASGFHPLAVRLVSAVLGGLLIPWMMVRLARRVWPVNDNLALLSAGLGAVYAYFVLFSAQLMTETFYISALLYSLERSLALMELLHEDRLDRRRALLTAVGLGISLGVAALFRQAILPWIALSFALLLWFGWKEGHLRETFVTLLLAGLVLIAFILPFTIRNYIVYGDFMLLNSNAGYAMYAAQHPMHGTSFQAFTAAPLPEDLNPPPENEAQWDRALLRKGFQYIVEDPGRYALLSISRIADYFMFWPAAQTSMINNIGRMLSFALFLPVMIYGLWISSHQWRRYWFLYAFMLFYTVMHLLTWSMIRYRLPVDALLLLFAALGLVNLGQHLRLIRAERRLPQNAPKM
jgi:hypothetical protein